MRSRTQGRRTLSALRSHPSFLAGEKRIGELGIELNDLTLAARSIFAAEAVEAWAKILPDHIIESDSESSIREFQSRARGLAVLGMTVKSYYSDPIRRAKVALLTATESASHPEKTKRQSLDSLDQWYSTWEINLSSAASLQLRSSLTLIDKLAARWLLPNDLLHSDPDDPDGPST